MQRREPVVVGGGLKREGCVGVAAVVVDGDTGGIEDVGLDGSSRSRSGAGDMREDEVGWMLNCLRRIFSLTSPFESRTSHSISPSISGRVVWVSKDVGWILFSGTSVLAPNIRAPRAR